VLEVLADDRRTAVARLFRDAHRVSVRHALATMLVAAARLVDDDEPERIPGTLTA
jgi:hypothetical protein